MGFRNQFRNSDIGCPLSKLLPELKTFQYCMPWLPYTDTYRYCEYFFSIGDHCRYFQTGNLHMCGVSHKRLPMYLWYNTVSQFRIIESPMWNADRSDCRHSQCLHDNSLCVRHPLKIKQARLRFFLFV